MSPILNNFLLIHHFLHKCNHIIYYTYACGLLTKKLTYFTAMKKSNSRLKQLNDYLTIILLVIVAYILLAPLLPQISFWVRSKVEPVRTTPITQDASPVKHEDIPADNTLVIPSMYLRETVHEGPYEDTLSKGVWHRPHTSTPDQGGNTVFAGHRFTYHGAAVFYNLDKVSVGDLITLYWNGEKYEYRVYDIQEVSPNAVEIEKNTETPMLTLYTCTPLWTVQKRLVIQAVLVEQKP